MFSFVPSRVDGLAEVELATVYSDRLELQTPSGNCVYRWIDIAQWPRPRLISRLLYTLGMGPKFLPVADRDWFHEPQDMFFRFFTDPVITVYMPSDEIKDPMNESCFFKIQQVLRAGGFQSCDLG